MQSFCNKIRLSEKYWDECWITNTHNGISRCNEWWQLSWAKFFGITSHRKRKQLFFHIIFPRQLYGSASAGWSYQHNWNIHNWLRQESSAASISSVSRSRHRERLNVQDQGLWLIVVYLLWSKTMYSTTLTVSLIVYGTRDGIWMGH